MKRTRVHVRQADIDGGARSNYFLCPVALALNRAVGGTHYVGNERYYRSLGGFYQDGELHWHSERVAQFVLDFDKGRPVKPMYFYVENAG